MGAIGRLTTSLTSSPGSFRASAPRWVRIVAPAFGAGVAMTLSVPPYGFWPLAWAGFAILYWRLGGLGWRGRMVAGAAAGLGLFGTGIFWITEFQQFGYVALLLLEASFMALTGVLTPPRRGRALGFPAAVLLGEALRGAVPFGGFPLGGISLGQVSGPLAFSARMGGPLLLTGLAAAAGVGLAELAGRRLRVPAVAAAVCAVVVVLGVTNGSTSDRAPLTAAVVQGGGVRGLRAVYSDPAAVFERQVAASDLVRAPVDLVVWPEDVIDLDERQLQGSTEEQAVGAVAQRLGATVVAGIVEDAGAVHFRNAAVVWGPDGTVIGRYDKVHRVPFGEYVPGRALIAHVADLTIIPKDAIPGRGPGLVRTPAGPLGVLISYEVFFADRARAAVRAGGDVLLVPTNASSYKTSQVPTQELAAARLRAIETGRDVLQAGPTGYSAAIDDRGRLLTRTTLGRHEVRQATVHHRRGRTPYVATGDGPVLATAVIVLGAGWALGRKRRDALETASERPGDEPATEREEAVAGVPS